MKRVRSLQWLCKRATVLLTLACVGCSAVYRYRGLSADCERVKNVDWRVKHRQEWSLSRFGTRYVELFRRDERLEFLFYADGGKEQVLTFGPSLIFLPLPVIPWPPGIYHALTDRSTAKAIPKELSIYLYVRGRSANANLQIDFSKVDIVTDPPTDTRPFWERRNWTDATHFDYVAINGLTSIGPRRDCYRLTLPALSTDIHSIAIRLRDVHTNKRDLEMPAVAFKKGSGLVLFNGVPND